MKSKQFYFVQTLIEKGANINAQDNFGSTPYHYAAKFPVPLEIFVQFINLKDQKKIKDNLRWTPEDWWKYKMNILYPSITETRNENNVEIVKQLTQSKAKKSKKDEIGWSAYDWLTYNTNINPRLNLLHYAINSNQINLFIELLEKDFDMNKKDEIMRTPLHIAVINQKKDFAKLLIKKGADLTIKDVCNKTPLNYAEKNRDEEMMKILKPQL